MSWGAFYSCPAAGKHRLEKKNHFASLGTHTLSLSQCLCLSPANRAPPSFFSFSRWRLQGPEAQLGWVRPFLFCPSCSWFKACNYLLLGEAVNWIKVEGLGWVDHPPQLPAPSSPPSSHHLVGHTLIKCGKPDLDSASAFMASCWKKWNFPTEGASMPSVSVRVVCFIWPHSSGNTITYVISVSRLSLTGL